MGKGKIDKITSNISELDLFADLPAARLHFEGKEEHKTLLGGCCTIFMAILIGLIVLILANPII